MLCDLREREREVCAQERERERESVCVCVRVCVYIFERHRQKHTKFSVKDEVDVLLDYVQSLQTQSNTEKRRQRQSWLACYIRLQTMIV